VLVVRIMLVARVTADHRPGGMPAVTSDRAAALAALGHDVHVVTTSGGGTPGFVAAAVVMSEQAAGLTVHYTRSPAHNWSESFADGCAVLARALTPDVVHLDSFDRDRPWWSRLPCRKAVTMHGAGWGAVLTRWNLYRTGLRRQMPAFDGPALRAEAEALAKADAVLAVSRWEWRMLRDQYGLPRAKVVPNPIPSYFFEGLRPVVRPPGGYFLCAAVSGQAERGFAQAQAACARAGVPFREVRDVPRERMPAQYDGAKALLLVSHYAQGKDLSLAEARARGVPAILSPTGSYLDEAQPWDRHCELGDVEGLAALLRGYEPPAVPPGAADSHRPEWHAAAWLDAVAG
jgi:glycosyltransferase involved in cell wall biosynthesis